MTTYACQTFEVCDVRGQIPKSIYQVSYLLASDFPDNFPKLVLIKNNPPRINYTFKMPSLRAIKLKYDN